MKLQDWCNENDVVFCSTPFDHKSAVLLNEMGVPFFKIASGEITNLPLISHIGSFGKPILLSTGMANLGEIEIALQAIGDEHRHRVVLMHCISDYPARWEQTNLRAIQTIQSAFRRPVGFSDHSEGIELPFVAVGLGAVVIEKHLTLDRNMEGGDHKASLEPAEFRTMADKLKKLQIAMGDGIKRCMPSEKGVKKVARKSVYAKRLIEPGKIIDNKDLIMKRPGTGISPVFLDRVLGSRARQTIHPDQALEWKYLDLK